jgi:DNA ligase D-like protein (predicted ligase)
MQKESAQLFFVEPMECKEVRQLREIPTGKEWQYEIKWDGYRCIAIKQKGEVLLFSRNGNTFNQFGNLFGVLNDFRAKSFILDGEIVAVDESGKSNFNALQKAKGKPLDVHFYALSADLNGKNLISLPLSKRQEMLWEHFPRGDFFHHSTPIKGDVGAIAQKIQELGLEGIVSKKTDSIYTPGKISGAWIKRKLKQTDEFIIGGYVPSSGGVDTILVGKFAGKKLMYVEDVDDGFIPAMRRAVFQAIEKLNTEICPFANLPEKSGKTRWGGKRWDAEKMKEARWVKPKIVVEIAMNEWRPEKHLRHSEFRRLRPDKTAQQISKYPA